MTRAAYGKRVREPFPSDFAISGQLGTYFLNQDIWSHDVGRIGTELDLTITAITAGFRNAQSFLGTKARTDHAPADLVLAMRQTVGVLFWSLEPYFDFWSKQAESQPVPTYGMEHDVSLEALRPNRKRLYQMFSNGVAELQPVLKTILLPETLSELQRVASLPEEQFCYRDELWVRTIYEFAASYHKNVISRDHIIQALAPLYRGRAYCFLVDNRDASAEQIEGGTEALCQNFEHLKPQLLELWDGKK
jgi:hypothetical protein